MDVMIGSSLSATNNRCVTTYLPNELALKMDGAEATDLYLTIREWMCHV